MARNRVQFQKGLSLPEFYERYVTEEKCQAALIAMGWPDGFVCPRCGSDRAISGARLRKLARLRHCCMQQGKPSIGFWEALAVENLKMIGFCQRQTCPGSASSNSRN
jgi:hypothetical protein